LSCANWPACYGSIVQAGGVTTAERGARLAHRLSASAVGIVLLALFAIALAQRPRLSQQALLAGAGLSVAALLATIGAITTGYVEDGRLLPAVTVVNLGGGFALLALLALLRQTVAQAPASKPRSVPTRPARGLALLAGCALAAIIVQIVLGALVSAKFAALACPAFPLCVTEWPPGGLVETLDPFTPLEIDASRSIVRPQSLAALHWAHRVGAHVVLLVVLALAVALARARRMREAVALAALVVIQLGLGATAVLASLPLPVVLAHNLGAAALLAAVVVITYRIRRDAR